MLTALREHVRHLPIQKCQWRYEPAKLLTKIRTGFVQFCLLESMCLTCPRKMPWAWHSPTSRASPSLGHRVGVPALAGLVASYCVSHPPKLSLDGTLVSRSAEQSSVIEPGMTARA